MMKLADVYNRIEQMSIEEQAGVLFFLLGFMSEPGPTWNRFCEGLKSCPYWSVKEEGRRMPSCIAIPLPLAHCPDDWSCENWPRCWNVEGCLERLEYLKKDEKGEMIECSSCIHMDQVNSICTTIFCMY